MMTKEEAEALALKRNAHKGKSLAHKEWRATEGNGKWTVELIDSPSHRAKQGREKVAQAKQDALMAMMTGNFDALREATRKHLLARCDVVIGEYEAVHGRIERPNLKNL